MDARPTTEQRELEAAAVRLAENLGPTTVGDLDDLERRARLDAALTQAGWRELRTGTPGEPVASGVEVALVTRALARRVCDVAFIGPLLGHDLLRRAGIESSDGVERTVAVTTDLRRLATVNGVAVDAAGSATALFLGDDGGNVVEATLASEAKDGVDLTRVVCPIGPLDRLASRPCR